jgi:SPP1 family predicted phage head-tail adaptor
MPMTDRITLRQRVAGEDSIGQPVEDWPDFATVWGNCRFQSGAEAIRANAETSIVKVSIRIRKRSDLSTDMRAAHKGVEYNIKAILPDSQDTRFAFLVCEAAG